MGHSVSLNLTFHKPLAVADVFDRLFRAGWHVPDDTMLLGKHPQGEIVDHETFAVRDLPVVLSRVEAERDDPTSFVIGPIWWGNKEQHLDVWMHSPTTIDLVPLAGSPHVEGVPKWIDMSWYLARVLPAFDDALEKVVFEDCVY